MDEAYKNISKYKGGFTNGSTKKDFVKSTPLKIVPALSGEQLEMLGMKRMSYPTPINVSKGR